MRDENQGYAPRSAPSVRHRTKALRHGPAYARKRTDMSATGAQNSDSPLERRRFSRRSHFMEIANVQDTKSPSSCP